MSNIGSSGAASGGQLEEKADLDQESTDAIAKAKQLATDNTDVDGALQILFGMEKKCRVSNDNASLSKVCVVAMELSHDTSVGGSPELVYNTLQTLSTRRSQKMCAITSLVTTALPWCLTSTDSHTPISNGDTEYRNTLIEKLREITDGKLYLERQRAQLTRALATIKESSGDISGAATVLQQVHVETYGSLSKKEKVEYILEQLRLTLLTKDYVRSAIVAGKISKPALGKYDDYKIRYYELLSSLHRQQEQSNVATKESVAAAGGAGDTHGVAALQLTNDYYAMYQTPSVQEDESKWKPLLEYTVVFCAMSAHDNEQHGMLQTLARDQKLEKVPAYKSLIDKLLTQEIIVYRDLENIVTTQYMKLDAVTADGMVGHWSKVLQQRITQHNLRVVSKAYRRIKLPRLGQLLSLEVSVLEDELAGMVSNGDIYAKIDRPAQTVRFQQQQTPDAIVTDWSNQIDTLLNLVETTTHLIHKEQMTNAAAAKKSVKA